MAIRLSWGGLWRGQLRRISAGDEPRSGEADASAPAGDVYDWYVRGRDLLSSGDAAAAVQILSRTVEAEPQARSAREMLARAQFDARQYPEARESFAYLVERDPADHYAHFGLGLCGAQARRSCRGGGASGARRGDASRPRALRPGAARRARRRGPPMTRPAPVEPLQAADRPLAQLFDVALLDLDGVVYRGPEPVVHAAEALAAARAAGMRLSFVTNNALRPPDEVAARIRAAGVDAEPKDVATSAQAAATLLAEQLPAGGKVLVAGGEGLRQAVRERGLVPVARADEAPLAVVTGYDPELTYARLAEAVLAIFAGAVWIASNTDVTVPTERGLLPGAGAIVAFISAATKVTPQVAGKPERALHEEATRRSGAQRPLVVGDRLDTDIEGANGVGAPSLLVLTGSPPWPSSSARARCTGRPICPLTCAGCCVRQPA